MPTSSLTDLHRMWTPAHNDNPLDLQTRFDTEQQRAEYWANFGREDLTRDFSHASKKNRIILGWRDPEFSTEPLTVDIYDKGQNEYARFLISASRAGSGKTVLGGNIVEQIDMNTDCNILLFDGKPEFHYRRRPQTHAELVRKLMQINQQIPAIKPRAWTEMVSMSPAFVNRDESEDDIKVRYELEDMATKDIITMFGLKNTIQNDAKAILALENFLQDKKDGVLDKDGKEIDESALENPFLNLKMRNLYDKQVVGDTLNEDITQIFKNWRIIQYKTYLASEEEANERAYMLAYMSVAIREVCRARKNYKDYLLALQKNKTLQPDPDVKMLTKPVFIYVTEAQTALPGGTLFPVTKEQLRSVYTRYRYLGVSLILDCAGFNQVDPICVTQTPFIIAFKTFQKEADFLRKTLNPFSPIFDQLPNLDSSRTPNQAALINTKSDMNSLETFYPLPPMSAIN